MKLTINGFKTEAQVEAFWDWYSGQGEQDASIWFECRKEDGDIDISSINASSIVKPYWVADTYNVEVDLYE